MNIFSLFPTPICSVDDFITEEERKDLYKNIKQIEHSPHGALEGNAKSTHGKDNIILNEKILDKLQYSILNFATEYGLEGDVSIGKIWSSIQNKGSILKEHTHPDSVLSGVIYVNVNDDSKLYIHNPNPFIMFTQLKNNNNFNYQYYWLKVTNCQLIMFPSWLKHGKNNEVNQMDDRVIISFNVVRKQ